MSISIRVITTANRVRSFRQDNAEDASALLNSLSRAGQLFSGKPLIISSLESTEIFSPEAIACIEVETRDEVDNLLATNQAPAMTAMTAEQAAAPFNVRLDFYFGGGHVVSVIAEGLRKAVLAERLMNLTSIFDRPVITYRLPQGGVGLVNPKALTRTVITPGVPDLPKDAWRADPV
jgi:hypothetical protein